MHARCRWCGDRFRVESPDSLAPYCKRTHNAPPDLSPRCRYWSRQIQRGWLPNRSISPLGYHISTLWFGVYIWECVNVLYPLIEERRRALGGAA
ncbi:hypothetical protein [Nocardia sp. NPDC051981]|uniref:hypothetical protein n=1 Tax=Nocardia sp. NPDC051981 TaxID=3155417 RepID=UPI003448F9CC